MSIEPKCTVTNAAATMFSLLRRLAPVVVKLNNSTKEKSSFNQLIRSGKKRIGSTGTEAAAAVSFIYHLRCVGFK